MFQGYSTLSIDPKGRISMPTKHREQLLASCEGRLTITRHLDDCLLLYPRPRWESKRQELSRMSFPARSVPRLLVGNACDVELDSAGRLLIPADLRAAAGLTREVELLGLGDFFELWEPARRRECEKADLAGGLPADAANFSL